MYSYFAIGYSNIRIVPRVVSGMWPNNDKSKNKLRLIFWTLWLFFSNFVDILRNQTGDQYYLSPWSLDLHISFCVLPWRAIERSFYPQGGVKESVAFNVPNPEKTVTDGQVTSKERHGRASTANNNTMVTPRPQTLRITPISPHHHPHYPLHATYSHLLDPTPNILGHHQHQNDNFNTTVTSIDFHVFQYSPESDLNVLQNINNLCI